MRTTLDERVRSAVAALLHATGESQTELAGALGVSQAQVSRRQSGTAVWSLAYCDAVAVHYGIDPLDLLAGPTRAIETLPARRRRVPGSPADAAGPAAVQDGGA
ncbi:helix-turn-helix domain-containing protein [Streptomyces sp. NBC_00285]|uniref:helix-turn-helix domain-containing protein n=1 Tax=Streptomyces sp. NBC_00285 TaxID=2975700 RepID=UPI002E2E69DF|nr:helix-turn-helix transcriptional regulator [Streptomyces sp. NBC_00285]